MFIPLWLLIVFCIGVYMEGYVVTAWILVHYYAADVYGATVLSAVWPFLSPIAPFLLVVWIVKKMTGKK